MAAAHPTAFFPSRTLSDARPVPIQRHAPVHISALGMGVRVVGERRERPSLPHFHRQVVVLGAESRHSQALHNLGGEGGGDYRLKYNTWTINLAR